MSSFWDVMPSRKRKRHKTRVLKELIIQMLLSCEGITEILEASRVSTLEPFDWLSALGRTTLKQWKRHFGEKSGDRN